ncbi:MAG: helix-turn-helix transcriptional regulator [Lachnospiraceae bacterium]|nr:helix-turn-helix transcriptional regulator [Lachnospiraceae bacterium]
MNDEQKLSADENDIGSSRKPLSYLIRKARISLNISQRTFAKQLGITQAQLSRLENGTAIKPNRRTLQALVPYLMGTTYEDLLAMTGYSVDFTEEPGKADNLGMQSMVNDNLAEEFGNIKPELFEAAQGLYQYLDDPKNLVLIQKIFGMIKTIGTMRSAADSEAMKYVYLRDCILNLLQ